MTQVFFSYLRILLFCGFTLLGLQVPNFVTQYGDSLNAHLIEAQQSLNQFQDEADRFFHGNIEALIYHYRSSNDEVFQQGAESIQGLYQRQQLLAVHLRDFHQSAWHAYLQALATPLADIRNEVLQRFNYALQLRPQAIAFGLFTALLLMVLLESLLRTFLGFTNSSKATRKVTNHNAD